jgi:UDP-glucose 4-epimerase
MRYYISGCCGNLMSAVIPILLDQGHDVLGIDCYDNGSKNYNAFINKHIQDIDEDDWNMIVEFNPEVIIHAAAQIYGVKGFHEKGGNILTGDTQTTSLMLYQTKILNDLTNRAPLFTYISSSMVYETCPAITLKEDDVENPALWRVPRTEYGLSKYVGERMVQAFWNQYQIPYVIWRPFNIFAKYEKAGSIQGYSHVFADFFKQIVEEKKTTLPILGDGNQIRSFTWEQDAAFAIANFTTLPAAKNETYNIGTEKNAMTMKELANLIYRCYNARIYGKQVIPPPLKFEHLPIYKDDVKHRVPSGEKLKKLIGWEPQTTVEQAVEYCLDFYLEGK